MTEPPDPFTVPIVPIPPQAPSRAGLVDVGGARLFHWDTGGDGEAVVFLHAGVGSAFFFDYQQPVFAAAGYRAIAYSRRGHDGSEAGPPDRPGTASGDLLKLADALGLRRVHLVATALGGVYAADFALTFPDRVLTLTLASSVVAWDDKDYMARSAALRPHGFEEMPHYFRELGPAYRAANPDGTAEWVKRADRAFGERPRQGTQTPVTLTALKAIRAPVLTMTGDADNYTPPPVLKLLAGHMPGSEMHLVAGSGHSAFWEQPATFNRLVLDFLARHPA